MRINKPAISLKKLFKDLPIRNKLLLSFLFLIIVPLMLIGFFSFYTSEGLLKQKTEQYASDILMGTGENINVKLREIERLSFQIVSNMPIQQALKKANSGMEDEYEKISVEKTIDTQLKGFLSPDIDIAAIRIISLSDIAYYVNPASVNFNDVTEEEKKILAEGSGSALWFNTDARNQTIAVGRVINSIVNQEMRGYVFIYLKESSIYNIYKKTELFKNGDFFIIDKDGRMISYKEKQMLNTNIDTVAEGITPDSLKDNFITTRVNSRMYYIASRAINNGRWKIIAIIPTEQYEEDIIRLRSWTLVICGSSCVLSLLISLGLSGSISMPLRKLSAMMVKVGKGDFNVSSSYESRDEVGILSSHFNKMVEQVQKLIQEVYQEQYLKQKAELKSLRMQINPHFLYNTLESINWMARMKNAPEIGEMVKALGDLMRVSIGGDDFISVKEEIDNIANYLMIQKFRYGDRFEAFIDIGENIGRVMIPKLILQPIVENAIVHGLEEKIENGLINITGTQDEGKVIIAICDDGVGMDEVQVAAIMTGFGSEARYDTDLSYGADHHHDNSTPSGASLYCDSGLSGNDQPSCMNHTHIGLINVDKRIKLYYGQEYGISIISYPGRGTSVKVTFPLV